MELRLIEPRQMVVTQSNELATSAYSMSLLEKRMVLLVASAMRQGDEYMKRYSFPAVEVMRFLGLQNNRDGYHRLQELTGTLLSRVVTFKTHEARGYKQFQWMAGAAYIPASDSHTGHAQLELQVHSQMRPFLLELKERFSSIPFGEIAQLPSFHSMRIFEILWAESYQLKRERVRFELAELKRILKVEKNYPNFAHFRQRVLDKAQRDLSERTPITFTYEVEKHGQKVVAVVFTVTANKRAVQLGLNLPHRLSVLELPPEPETVQASMDAEKTLKRLQASGLREAQAREFIATYGTAYLEENLDAVEERQKKGQVKHLLSYTLKAIAQDYRKQESEEEKTAKASRTAKEQRAKQQAALEAQYDRERARVLEEVKGMVPGDVALEEFRPHIEALANSNAIIGRPWKEARNSLDGIEANPVLRSIWQQFLLDTYATPQLRSFEAWRASQK